MLPHGGVHLPCKFILTKKEKKSVIDVLRFTDKGIARIAKKLGFDFAEAVVRIYLLVSPLVHILFMSTRRVSSSRNGERFRY